MEEIREALFQIEDNSTPGPNGMNLIFFFFFKLRWEQLKMELWEAMLGVQESGLMMNKNKSNIFFSTKESWTNN